MRTSASIILPTVQKAVKTSLKTIQNQALSSSRVMFKDLKKHFFCLNPHLLLVHLILELHEVSLMNLAGCSGWRIGWTLGMACCDCMSCCRLQTSRCPTLPVNLSLFIGFTGLTTLGLLRQGYCSFSWRRFGKRSQRQGIEPARHETEGQRTWMEKECKRNISNFQDISKFQDISRIQLWSSNIVIISRYIMVHPGSCPNWHIDICGIWHSGSFKDSSDSVLEIWLDRSGSLRPKWCKSLDGTLGEGKFWLYLYAHNARSQFDDEICCSEENLTCGSTKKSRHVFPQTVYFWGSQCFLSVFALSGMLCPPPGLCFSCLRSCLRSCLPAGLGCCVRLPACVTLVSGLVSHLVSQLVWSAVCASRLVFFLSPVLSPILSLSWSGVLCVPRGLSFSCLRSCLPSCLSAGLGCCVRLPAYVSLVSGLVSHLVSQLVWSAVSASRLVFFLSPVLSPILSLSWSGMLCPPPGLCFSSLRSSLPSCLSAGLECCVCLAACLFLVSGLVSHLVSQLVWGAVSASRLMFL